VTELGASTTAETLAKLAAEVSGLFRLLPVAEAAGDNLGVVMDWRGSEEEDLQVEKLQHAFCQS
jgi:hypothetical protein